MRSAILKWSGINVIWHCYKKHNNRASRFLSFLRERGFMFLTLAPFNVDLRMNFAFYLEFHMCCQTSQVCNSTGSYRSIPRCSYMEGYIWLSMFKKIVDSISFGLIAWFICTILFLLCRCIDYGIAAYSMSSFLTFTFWFWRMQTVLGDCPKHVNVVSASTFKMTILYVRKTFGNNKTGSCCNIHYCSYREGNLWLLMQNKRRKNII